MKKFLTVIIMVFAMTAGSFSTASAMDFLIGAKGGYYTWDPFLKRIGVSQFEEIDRGDGALYGPIFSVLFTPDVSFSVSGLYGKQSTGWSAVNYYEGSSNPRTGTFTFDVTRIDIDSALSLRLTDNLKYLQVINTRGLKWNRLQRLTKMEEFPLPPDMKIIK